jgi:predicted transcriptional regulator
MEWQTCAAISQASGADTKTVGAELRALVEAGVVESEGKTRGKTYRLVSQ